MVQVITRSANGGRRGVLGVIDLYFTVAILQSIEETEDLTTWHPSVAHFDAIIRLVETTIPQIKKIMQAAGRGQGRVLIQTSVL
jgi:hypothetical protein